VDEHFHTVLFAVAILHHQTTSSFEWALNQMKSSVSGDVWSQVTSVFTDGDAAMSAALVSVLPDSRHLRCRYHLEINLRSNLHTKLTVVEVEEFISAWKDVINMEREPAFLQAKETLHNKFPAAAPYLEKNHWPHALQFVECYISDVTTFGLRSTARVESWNSLLKGALQVNSTTALPILFQALQFAASEVDRRRLRDALVEAARLPVLPRKRTFAEEIYWHLTYFAQQKTQLQWDVHHNYQFEQKTVAAWDSVWYVWDQRPITTSSVAEEKREVVANPDTMRCSCNFPVTYLLPCRHVLRMNLHLTRAGFVLGQVGKRWLRYHKPIVVSAESASQPAGLPPPLSVEPIPTFNSTLHLPTALPARKARYGQIMGFAMTICARAAEYTDIFHPLLTKMQEAAAWAEEMTAASAPTAPPVSMSSSSSTASTSHASAADAPSALHATVAVNQVRFPLHKKRQKGREKQSRQVGIGESAAKREKLVASQQR
jgi:hypothetical protein